MFRTQEEEDEEEEDEEKEEEAVLSNGGACAMLKRTWGIKFEIPTFRKIEHGLLARNFENKRR